MSSCLYAIEFKDKTWKIGGSNNAILRLNNYKGPCKPVFCVVQVLEEYNSHESALINNMKKSPEWELSDGNEYFAPQIPSEDAKKWIITYFTQNIYLPPFWGSKEDTLLYLKEQVKVVFNGMMEDFDETGRTKEVTFLTCNECQKTFDSEHNLKCHQYRELNKPPAERCGVKRERKLKMIEAKERKTRAKQQIQESGLTHIVETANESSRTNELLQQLQDQMGEIKEQNNHLKDKVYNIEQQNNDLKEMVTEFARNPKLLVLVDKLYPIQSLREVDLKMPAFKPVLEILDNELPEYANLAQEKTGKVHCKAVRKLNEIQPTTVKDDEKLFCKDGDVIAKADNMDTTKEFINVMANSGFEYAQKASVDLKSKRESDQPFLETILKNASCDTIQNLQEIVI